MSAFDPLADIMRGSILVGMYRDPSLDRQGTIGGKWGCALAALVGIPLLVVAAFLSLMADCEGPCVKSLHWPWIIQALGVTATVGFGSRAIINALVRRNRP